MPNRILKESICTSDSLDKLNSFQENVFYRLIVNCDDFGRMDARPKVLASRLYPLKDIRAEQIETALQALSSAGLVILYQVDGKPFVQMKTWERHQQIRAKKSKYPAPESQTQKKIQKSDINCNQMKSDDNECTRNPIQSNPIVFVTREREDDEFDDLMKNAAKNDLVYQAAEGIALSGTTSLQNADRLIADYSADWVLEAIKRASLGPKDVWSWRYIEAILCKWKQAGGIEDHKSDQGKTKTRKVREKYVVNGETKIWEHEVPV